MSVFSKLFSAKSEPPREEIRPRNFIDCLDIVRVWNAKATYNFDIDMNDTRLQAAMNTLVTCPYCSESYYFADSLGFSDARLTVECPHCHTSPAEDASEEYVA